MRITLSMVAATSGAGLAGRRSPGTHSTGLGEQVRGGDVITFHCGVEEAAERIGGHFSRHSCRTRVELTNGGNHQRVRCDR